MGETVIKLKNITKSFGTVNVIKDINITIERGMVYALAGENGAGKSTLCNIISGGLRPDKGAIEYGGRDYEHFTIEQAKSIGVKMVHQELQVLPLMTIEENIFIGDEVANCGFTDRKAMKRKTKELLEAVGLAANPETRVADIEIAGRQLIEIARAINNNASIIILDEPTSSLSKTEIKKLFDIINKLKARGVSVVFISHRLEEVFELSDKIIVLKDGSKVAELETCRTHEDEIIQLMVGRSYSDFYNRKRTFDGKEILRVENISGARKGLINNAYMPKNISFCLYEGEVLGISGLVGAGRTELIKLMFGELPTESGEIFVDSKKVKIKSSKDAIRLGMAWVTEDRKKEGVILDANVKSNLTLPVVHQYLRGIFIDDGAINFITDGYIKKLRVKTTGGRQKVRNLSGGNQQKVVLSKWLSTNPRILVLDEPTRGIDVGAKAEIYKLINELTSEGIAILIISSELPEVMGMSDRILVMYEGEITGEVNREEFSEARIMEYATGRKVNYE